tara:strand:+ start:456 stop:824 length:369 start_codon:yes stop_codon:yes gene_type:complete
MLKLITKVADKIFDRLLPEITRLLEVRRDECYTVSQEMAQAKDLSFTKDEKKYLQKISQDPKFISVVDKLIFAISLSAINSADDREQSEKKGGVRALMDLKTKGLGFIEKKPTDHLTGKRID